MPSGHPDGLPDLFLDRSLGRVQVSTLLRTAGLRVRQCIRKPYFDATHGH